MSTKKNKNKVKNKPPTLQTKAEAFETEKSEVDTPTEEIPDIFKPEERVPEIVSEIVPTVAEIQVSEADAPKKPKRNRGKKKNNEISDESENFQEQKTQEPGAEGSKLSLEPKNLQEKEEALRTPEVTPVARRKKNKNKKQELPNEGLVKDEFKIAPLKKGQEITDLKIITVVPVETEESKSKKKNKKKKRTDSERSEKADEVLACTAAFQKLLESRDDKKDKKEIKQDIKPTEDTTVPKIPDHKDPIKVPKDELIKAESVPEEKSTESKDTSREEESKAKKKNKKEKKHQPKLDTDDEMKSTQGEIEFVAGDIPSIMIPTETKEFSAKEILKEKAVEIIEDRSPITKEKSPKPTAKIAKPVDKKQKQKGKGDFSSTENLAEKDKQTVKDVKEETTAIAQQSIKFVPVVVKQETKSVDLEKSLKSQDIELRTEPVKEEKSKTAEKIIPVTATVQEPANALVIDTLPIEIKPEIKDENLMQVHHGLVPLPGSGRNKNRKRSPKPKQSTEKVIPETINVQETAQAVVKETLPIEVKTEIKDKKFIPVDLEFESVPDTGKNKNRKKSPTPKESTEKVIPETTTVRETAAAMIEETNPTEIKTEIKDENLIKEYPRLVPSPDSGRNKNRKRSPKPKQSTEKEVTEIIAVQETATALVKETIPIEIKTEQKDENIIPVDLRLVPASESGKNKNRTKSPKPKQIIEKIIPETPIVQESLVKETLPVETQTKIKDENVKPKDLGFDLVPDSGKNKNRKKSPKPKPSEIKEPASVQVEPAQNKEQLTSFEDILKSMPDAPEIKSDQLNIKQPEIPPNKENLPVLKAADVKAITTEPEKVPSKDTESFPLNVEIVTAVGATRTMILETPDAANIPNILKERTPEKQTEKENIETPEVPSNKKRKKSPKPKKADIVSESTQQATDVVKDMPREQKEKTSPSMPSLEDIDIKSVKTDESEGSACDIIPDVQYPRASSQQQDTNNNNNTVIQEIITSDAKLNIPVITPDTPFIQGSGEISMVTPEIITTGIKIKEVDETKCEIPTTSKTFKRETSPKPEERTDLKSKVLDVNQGMEELRKSIERSLAELNAMERSEKDAEAQFAKAQAKLEAISDLAVKKNQDKKQPSPSQKLHEVKEKPKKQLAEELMQKPKEKSPLPSSPITTSIKTERAKKDKSPLSYIETEMKKPGLATPITKTEDIKEQPITDIKLTDCKAAEQQSQESFKSVIPQPQSMTGIKSTDVKNIEQNPQEVLESITPQPPARKDNRGKGKKKKGKQETEQSATPTSTSGTTTMSSTTSDSKEITQETKKEEKTEQKSESSSTQEKGKQQSATVDSDDVNKGQDLQLTDSMQMDFEPIESFEDALTSSNEDDVNKNFEMIANDSVNSELSENPEINITAPTEDEDKNVSKDTKDGERINPVTQPKNLLGHPNIPARLNKTDYKKEKNKTPNTKQAKVRIKDDVKDPIEITKQSKESQTENKRRFLKDKTVTESISSVINENEEYIYKYSFRKVFLPSACHVCKKDLKPSRVPCSFCNLVFYCSAKHKDEDYPLHQGLCFAVSSIVHLKDQKHIYADAKNITGHEYRLLRMQMIVSCEKVLKRRLVPWEQEALLYPRICADVGCREWRQNLLMDCEGCGQVAYCANDPTHLPSYHQRWCKSYSLYNKLVVYQQTKGRLEPQLPTRVLDDVSPMPEKLNEVLSAMYEEKIDMTDIQYAALTQIATAPLTAAYCQQLYSNRMNAVYANGVGKKSSFTIHIVGAELQFEADALNKWEVFFLHLHPTVKELRVVLIGADLNPSQLPLDLLGKIKMCDNCRQNKRRVIFEFQDKKTYYEYWSTEFVTPDLVCAFNPSIHRCSVFNGNDPWPVTIRAILKLRVPFVITAHTLTELQRDLFRISDTCNKQVSPKNTCDTQVSPTSTCDIQVSPKDENQVVVISEPKCNAFASVRPDRNFISDDEMPLLFNNYCFALVSGAF